MSKQAVKIFKENLWTNNPIFIQVLGICSTLAVTNNLKNTLIMTGGVTFATAFSALTLSAMKDLIPRKVRMIVQVLIISFYVIIIDIILRAYLPDISKQLGPYVGLIITNCIIMGRVEAFAQANKPFISFWDGLTSGLGYMAVLVVIAVIREFLGFGTLLNIPLVGESFEPWTIMVMPPSAFFILALLMWAASAWAMAHDPKKKPKPQPPVPSAGNAAGSTGGVK